MRRLLHGVVAVLVLGGFAIAYGAEDKKPADKPPADKAPKDKKPTDKPPRDKKPAEKIGKPAKEEAPTGSAGPPTMRFQHTTQNGNKGTFELNGKSGTAEYVFDGMRHKDKLVYVRTGSLDGVPAWVYQVERKGKKVNLWFLFGSKPVRERGGQKLYPMFYSQQPDNASGKKPWNRIRTPSGTQGTPLAEKPSKED